MKVVSTTGRFLYALAIIALGVQTIVCAHMVGHSLGPQYAVIPALPWLPAIPWVAYLFGAIWVVCGAGLLSRQTLRKSAMLLGSLLFLCGLFLDIPKYVPSLADIGLRTIVCETFSLMSLAWLLPRKNEMPAWLVGGSRRVLGVALIALGVDHFLILPFIASLIPAWIPWHMFWSAFFGVVLIAAGLSIGVNWMSRWGAAGAGTTLGIWVLTLHIPRVLGLYGIPNAPHDPNEWSSLFIAIAFWGGLWALTSESA
jgi:uncharacterized membrane protein